MSDYSDNDQNDYNDEPGYGSQDEYDDDDGYGFREDEKAEEETYGESFKDRERATTNSYNALLEVLLPPSTDKTSRFKTQEQKVIVDINRFINELVNEDYSARDNYIPVLAKLISGTVKNIGSKNPYAFVLGYLASNGGTDLNKKHFNEIISLHLHKIDAEAGVKPEDVLRYSRYWMQSLT